MTQYNTPEKIASILARWAPRKINNILEPSVGKGVLLKPILPRLIRCNSKVFCVDIDPNMLEVVKKKYSMSMGESLKLYHNDFLEMKFNENSSENMFDCIIMNPPFCGKKIGLVHTELPDSKQAKKRLFREVPIEGAFLIKAVNLLKEKGRILAIVPSSVISAENGKWLRKHLMEKGCICYVHELPRNSFKSTDVKVFLFVFEKTKCNRKIIICNHNIIKPDRLILDKGKLLEKDIRFDYSYHSATNWHKMLQNSIPGACWKPLSEYAMISRGKLNSKHSSRIIHSTNFKNGFWKTNSSKTKFKSKQPNSTIQTYDLLIKRVGRNCFDSIGPTMGASSKQLSDCVLRIRPIKRRDKLKLLFALRCLLSCQEGKDLIERGSCASYIVQFKFSSLLIPINLFEIYYGAFKRYKSAVERYRFAEMKKIEKYVQSRLKKRIKNYCEKN